MFYYAKIEGLKPEDEVSESLDASMIGNIWHSTMHFIFLGQERITRAYLNSWLDREDDIRRKVRSLICETLKTEEVTGRNLVTENVIVRYVRQAIIKDIELLDSRGIDSFEIYGLEKKMVSKLHGFDFIGYIDRLDSLEPGTARVVDYKSGKDSSKLLKVTDDSVQSAMDVIFNEKHKKRMDGKAAFQFYIYDRLLKNEPEFASLDLYNSMYAVKEIFKNVPRVNEVNEAFCSCMDEKLKEILDEIVNPDIPFRMASDKDACTYCEFKTICGR